MRILGELIDLVLPSNCVCCQAAGSAWCGGCRPASEPGLAASATGPPTYFAAEYAGELRTALLAYKERSIIALSAPLAGYLSDAVDVACRAGPGAAGRPVLVPVPSARSAARRRGGDHLHRVARLAALDCSVRLAPLLRLTGPVADSAGLSAAQRAVNLTGRMAAAPAAVADLRPVIVVDDIVTTGATLAEAERALRAAGWPVLAGAVIAATRRRWPAEIDTAGPVRPAVTGQPRGSPAAGFSTD